MAYIGVDSDGTVCIYRRKPKWDSEEGIWDPNDQDADDSAWEEGIHKSLLPKGKPGVLYKLRSTLEQVAVGDSP